MNNEQSSEHEILNLLKKQFLQGPSFRLENRIGINCCSGTEIAAYYELWGETQVFRLLISKMPSNLFISRYLGKNHLVLLIEEDENMTGGIVSLKDELSDEFSRVFPHIGPKSIKELQSLWAGFVQYHYLHEISRLNE